MSGGDPALVSQVAKGIACLPSPGNGLPRLFLWKRDLCQLLGVGMRTLERMISSGEVPAPDRRLRGRPVWLASRFYGWASFTAATDPGMGKGVDK